MEITRIIGSHADQLLPHQLLLSWLKDYKRPNDKILGLKAQGILEPLKKGLYMAGPSISETKPDTFLIANHLVDDMRIDESALKDLDSYKPANEQDAKDALREVKVSFPSRE